VEGEGEMRLHLHPLYEPDYNQRTEKKARIALKFRNKFIWFHKVS